MRRDIKWVLTLVLASGVIGLGAASAADLPVKARPMPVVAAYNWSGCYLGGNLGGKWAQTSGQAFIPGATGFGVTTPAGTLPFGSLTASPVIGGGQIGCNWQAPGSHWVFGVEGDADAQRWGMSRTTVGALGAFPGVFVPGDNFTVNSTWQASLRGRIGYAWDRWMLYATGGIAFTNERISELHRDRRVPGIVRHRQQDAGWPDHRSRCRICAQQPLELGCRGPLQLVWHSDLQWRHGRGDPVRRTGADFHLRAGDAEHQDRNVRSHRSSELQVYPLGSPVVAKY